ncbi:hypothetical protein ATANTOWER_005987 [Ataeniobius toweri]|uniref:Uncharacterized protein n=1 Tax=Ataeniobius toweri TaxID=208326 RepID=A0ABU7AFC0_9TELE|nr:hypothetical protein [Ataeniobius toweri]
MTITLSHPHVHIQTLTPLTQPKDTQEWMLYTQSHSPYTVYTLRSRYQYPRGATSSQTQEVVPFSPAWRKEDHLNHQSRLGPASLKPKQPQLRPRTSKDMRQ